MPYRRGRRTYLDINVMNLSIYSRISGLGGEVHRGQLQSIIKLRHGVSQAVARLTLSHAPGATYSINEALAFVGAASISTRRHRRGELLADADALAEMGILIAGEMLVAEALSRQAEA